MISEYPSVLFLPGAGGDPEFWRGVGERLPRPWIKHYLGWPGLGAQPPEPNVNGFDDLVRIAEERLVGSSVDLVAQSMGGAVALRVALRQPRRIRRLVLAATSGGIDVTRLGAADWRADYRREFPAAAAWITKTRPDFAAELPRVVQPVLLLWGDADRISPLAVGERLRHLLPNTTLHVVPGGDHGFASARAAEIAPVIERFLGEQERPR